MVEVVDAIVAELIIRDVDKYEGGFNRATAAHEKFLASGKKLSTFSFDLAAEGRKYKGAVDGMAQAEEQSSAKITRARKARTTVAKASDEAEVASAKIAAKAKADAEIAEASRSARIRAGIDRGVARSSVTPGSGANLGGTVTREGDGGRALLAGTRVTANAGATAEVAAATEINHLAADRFDLEQRVVNATGRQKRELQDQIEYLRRIDVYKKAGLTDDAAMIRAEAELAVIGSERAKTEKSRVEVNLARFAEGAGIRRLGGGTAAIAGLATAAAVGVGVEVIKSAVDYGKALADLSTQLGITVEDLQAYQHIARETGVSQEALTSAFGKFSEELGRAKEGGRQQSKVFQALGIDIKSMANAGEALPTVIDALGKVKDQADRASIETALFGQSGRKLDEMLTGGAASVSELAKSLQATGKALSAKEIQELDNTARKLEDVKNQLSVDFARIVAGNAEAIIGLAQSFEALSGSILGTIQKLQLFGAQQIDSGFLSGATSGADKAVARRFRLGSSEGRQQLFKENYDALEANRRNAGEAPARIIINGQDVTNSPGAVATRGRAAKAEETRLLAERREIFAADAAAKASVATTTPVQPNSPDLKAIRSLYAPKGPKGKSADQIAKEAEERTKQFNDQLASAQENFLRAQEALTGSVQRRAEIEQQLLKLAHEARLKDIDSQKAKNILSGADKGIEEARAKSLKFAENNAYAEQQQGVEQDKQLELQRALTQAQQTLLDAQAVTLNAELAMANTAKDRARIERDLLANQKEQERVQLQGVINASKPGDPAAADAKAKLGTLDQRFAAQGAASAYANRGPLKQYLDTLPRTAAQLDEELQNAAVHGLSNLNDGLTTAISKFLHLHGIAGQFIEDLIKIGVERELLIPLANQLFPSSGGDGGSGGLFGTILGAARSVLGGGGGGGGFSASGVGDGLAGFRAGGGNVVGGRTYEIGERGKELVTFGASGHVYPNGAVPNLTGAGGGPSQIVLHVEANDYFDAKVASISGPIAADASVRVVRATAPGIAQSAVQASPGQLQRLQKLGTG